MSSEDARVTPPEVGAAMKVTYPHRGRPRSEGEITGRR
jgi:hypothetical protein